MQMPHSSNEDTVIVHMQHGTIFGSTANGTATTPGAEPKETSEKNDLRK
jgi:hypothetical protein